MTHISEFMMPQSSKIMENRTFLVEISRVWIALFTENPLDGKNAMKLCVFLLYIDLMKNIKVKPNASATFC